MSDTVIRVENLCKKYIIGHHKQERYETFRDRMNHVGRCLLQRLRHPLSANKENVDLEEFWALKDVNFEIKRGDRIGIIGRNGAGKSTLLKILSRITEPTSGRISIKGRVASLLEVGTGFHPELTGRENIYLNGAILGMSRIEIKKKFDEIVDFAEIEKFLDTPVKRYSSGMYVRLAFAVAAHLEPEILLVDEVLAVGDTQFQTKCLGKMGDVAKEGRTVLFVSHNMGAIQNLCLTTMLFVNGCLNLKSKTKKVINRYLNSTQTIIDNTPLHQRMDRNGTGVIIFTEIKIADKYGIRYDTVTTGSKIYFSIRYYAKKTSINVIYRLQIANDKQGVLLTCNNFHTSGFYKKIHTGDGVVICEISKIPLLPGRYTVHLQCSVNGQISDEIENTLFFYVIKGDYFGTGKIPDVTYGCITEHNWMLVN